MLLKNAGQPLEERVQIQALSVDLREAVMACLSGGESRRWTVLELVERFKSLGVCASRAGRDSSARRTRGSSLSSRAGRRGACSQLSISRRLPIVVAQNVSSTRFQTPRNTIAMTKTRGRQRKRADFVEFGETGLPDLIVVILADNRPVAARVQKFQISKEEEPDRRMR